MNNKNEMSPEDKMMKAIWGDKWQTEAEREAEIDAAVNKVTPEEFKMTWGISIEEHTRQSMLFAGWCDAVIKWEHEHGEERKYHVAGDFKPVFSRKQAIDMVQMAYRQGQEDDSLGISEYDRLWKVNKGEPVTIKKSVDERLADIMALKDFVGEFSVDLYYDNFGGETPYVAKVHSVFGNITEFNARAKSFSDALDMVDEYLNSLG